MNGKKLRHLERSYDDEQGLSLWQAFIAVLSSHIGVRPKARREADFGLASGLHVFIVALIYFFVVLALLEAFPSSH